MSITNENELIGMQQVSEAVAHTLKRCKLMPGQVCRPKNWMTMEHRFWKALVPNRHRSFYL